MQWSFLYVLKWCYHLHPLRKCSLLLAQVLPLWPHCVQSSLGSCPPPLLMWLRVCSPAPAVCSLPFIDGPLAKSLGTAPASGTHCLPFVRCRWEACCHSHTLVPTAEQNQVGLLTCDLTPHLKCCRHVIELLLLIHRTGREKRCKKKNWFC